MIDKTKNCPFCDYNQTSICSTFYPGGNKTKFYIRCVNCGSQGAEGDTLEEAIANWNRRNNNNETN